MTLCSFGQSSILPLSCFTERRLCNLCAGIYGRAGPVLISQGINPTTAATGEQTLLWQGTAFLVTQSLHSSPRPGRDNRTDKGPGSAQPRDRGPPAQRTGPGSLHSGISALTHVPGTSP